MWFGSMASDGMPGLECWEEGGAISSSLLGRLLQYSMAFLLSESGYYSLVLLFCLFVLGFVLFRIIAS